MEDQTITPAEFAIVEVMQRLDAETLALIPDACRAPLVANGVARAAGVPVTDLARAQLGTSGAFAIWEAHTLRLQPHPRPSLLKWEAVLEGIAQWGRELGEAGIPGLRYFQLRIVAAADHVLDATADTPDRAPDLLAFYVLVALAQGMQPHHTGANFALAAMMDDVDVRDLFDV